MSSFSRLIFTFYLIVLAALSVIFLNFYKVVKVVFHEKKGAGEDGDSWVLVYNTGDRCLFIF
jgi:hypothetical protein